MPLAVISAPGMVAQHRGERDEHLCRNQSDPERSLPTGHRYVGHRWGRVAFPIDRDATRVLLGLYHRPRGRSA
jgi:hypothetical protein